MTTRKPLVIISGELSELPDGDSIAGVSGGSIIEQGNSSVEVIDTGTDGRVVVTTDGVESARFTTDGKVGIGTDTPEEKLHVAGAGTDNVGVYISNEVSALEIVARNGEIRISADTAGDSIVFRVNGEPTLIVSGDDESVLIGTDTNPDGYKLLTEFGLADFDDYSEITGSVASGIWVDGDLVERSAVVIGFRGLEDGITPFDHKLVLRTDQDNDAAIETTSGHINLRAKTRVQIFRDDVEIAQFGAGTNDDAVLIGTDDDLGTGCKLYVSGVSYSDNYDIGLTTEGSDTVALDFSGGTGLSTRAAAGTVTFTASNYRAGAIKTVRIIAGGSSRTLTFPTNWVFVGAKPASIASGKTGILTVTSFGTTEADCVAAWAVQT